MADIRINALPTTASASSSDDYIALDGTTNGTRKLNAYSPTFGGNLTVNGTGTSSFASNINVNKSTAVVDIGDGTTGPNFRLVSSVTGDANAYLQIGKSSADTNANLIISRYSTGSTAINSASIYATTTLLSGNLTVSGNGLNTFGGIGAVNASILFGASNVANASAGYLSISQRLNYGFALFGYNMTGTSGSDAYTSPKNATGSAGVELIGGSLGITRFIYSTAATTAGNALTVTEAARFSTGNFLLGTTTDGGQKLQVAGTSAFNGDLTVYNQSTTGIVKIRGANGYASTELYDAGGNRKWIVGYDGSTANYYIARADGATAFTLDQSSNATLAGNLTVSGGTTTITGSAPALALKRSSDNSFVGYIDATTTGTLRLFSGVGGSNALAASFPQTGNLLLGTTIDGGQKLQVAGTAEIQSTLTVKGAEAGPTTGISSIVQNTTSANDRVAALRLVNASNQWNLRAVGSGDTFSIGPGLSGSETNYFTLSSAGNATFAGTIKPQQAATASAPTYVKGAIYFDTTLNKLRVGGATGWETITSV